MFEITYPRHGAVLNHHNGVETADALTIKVTGVCDVPGTILVNNQPVIRKGKDFSIDLPLTAAFNTITAELTDDFGILTRKITVLWDKASFLRYDFFIDDNIFFLTDITKERPKSLFDHFYLKFLKEMHEKYGTKFTLNLFFRNDHDFCELSSFPECYKGEFADNAHWLKMSWHSYSEFPDRPYQNAAPEKVAADYDLIKSEVCRFAGENSFIPPIAAHWSMIRPDGMEELVKRGVRVMTSQFINPKTSLSEKQKSSYLCDIGFFQNLRECLYLEKEQMLYSFDQNLLYLHGMLICNYWTPGEIRERLAQVKKESLRHEVLSLETHEQYTFPSYFNYIPDHMERMETAIRFAAEEGYKPVFFAEGLLGNMSWEK